MKRYTCGLGSEKYIFHFFLVISDDSISSWRDARLVLLGRSPQELVHSSNIHDPRSSDCPICRMPELEVHSASDEPHLEHRAAPRRPLDSHRDEIRTVLRMATDQSLARAAIDHSVPVVLGFNPQDGSLGQVVQVNTAFDLRLYDVPIHLIAEVGMRRE